MTKPNGQQPQSAPPVQGEVMEEPGTTLAPIENARTGELIPRGANALDLPPTTYLRFDLVGTLHVTEKEAAILSEDLDPNDVQIRPDGNIYLPWTWYAKRYSAAFGFGKWGVIPGAHPKTRPMGQSELVVWEHWLVIKGVPMGDAVGECNYYPSNSGMSYGDACEGAKSNAVMRLSKLLMPQTLVMWDRQWSEKWKFDNAVLCAVPGKKDGWYRKDSIPAGATPKARQQAAGQAKPATAAQTQQTKPPATVESATAAWLKLCDRADAVKVPYEPLPTSPTVDIIKARYAELRTFVEQAEAQAAN